MRWLVLAAVLAACSKSPVKQRTFAPELGRAVGPACPARPPGQPNGEGGTCKTDAECTAGKDGRCNPVDTSHGRMPSQNGCGYNACASDGDCKTGGPCECDGSRGNHCLAGDCRTDADCKSHSCGRSNSMDCWGGDAGYYCRTSADTCATYDDCNPPDHKGRGGQCVFQTALGHWACQEYPECPVG